MGHKGIMLTGEKFYLKGHILHGSIYITLSKKPKLERLRTAQRLPRGKARTSVE